ncbi:glycosyltransferase family 4 protein [Fodinicola feengrottensis]|uniref:glycosyltransferase family 4 protein n=2 Tax=Fodinicola feengrottensis TaxID=435914 RepID=UPI0031E01489
MAQSRRLRVGMLAVTNYESDPRVRRQAEALVARGDEVTVLALSSADRPRHELLDGVRVVHFKTEKFRGAGGAGYLKLYGDFGVRAGAWLAARPRRFDVIQAHSMPEVLVFCAAVQKLVRVPLLLDVHDMTSRLFESKFGDSKIVRAVHASETMSMAFANEVMTVHEPYAEALRARTKRPVTSVLNSPDEAMFTPSRWRGWDPAGEVVFSYHGTIAPRHGLVALVEALALVRKELPKARLQVRGGGDGLAAVAEKVQELGMQDVVDLPERVYAVHDMPAQIDRVHIGVAPNQLDIWTADTLPTKLLEYAAMGVPSISFKNPVVTRYFPDDAVSYVDPASAQNLATAMLALAKDPEAARKQADRASEVMAELSWAKQKLIYLDVLDRMAGK